MTGSGGPNYQEKGFALLKGGFETTVEDKGTALDAVWHVCKGAIWRAFAVYRRGLALGAQPEI